MSNEKDMVKVQAKIVNAKYDYDAKEVVVKVVIKNKIKKAIRLRHEVLFSGGGDNKETEEAMLMWADSFMIRKKKGLGIEVEMNPKELEE